jgi:NAD(P)-dependent dehydrogenase (short-subunit alcohol dehydrogenase family)
MVFDLDGPAAGSAASAIAAQGLAALPFPVDVTDEARVAEAVRAVIDAEGRIDIVVNNAGIYPHSPFEELTFAEWRRVLSTNLDSVFLVTRAAYPHMRERGYGRS